jgi:hypothetical protein
MKKRTRERKEVSMLKLSSLIFKKLQTFLKWNKCTHLCDVQILRDVADISYLCDIYIPTG